MQYIYKAMKKYFRIVIVKINQMYLCRLYVWKCSGYRFMKTNDKFEKSFTLRRPNTLFSSTRHFELGMHSMVLAYSLAEYSISFLFLCHKSKNPFFYCESDT